MAENFSQNGDNQFCQNGDTQFSRKGDTQFSPNDDTQFSRNGDTQFSEFDDTQFSEFDDTQFSEIPSQENISALDKEIVELVLQSNFQMQSSQSSSSSTSSAVVGKSETSGSSQQSQPHRKLISSVRENREKVIEKIEHHMLAILTALSEDEFPVLSLKQDGEVTSQVKLSQDSSRKKFTVLTVIMSKACELLHEGRTMTKRDLYYENVQLFGNQTAVNGGIEDVCSILEITPSQLPFIASPKGLMAGKDVIFKITSKEGVQELLQFKPKATLIPPAGEIRRWGKLECNAKFVLIVEKDAVFHRLIEEGIFDNLEPFILVTGKGYPDKVTRVFVSKLSKDLTIPIFILVDGDPYGLEIASIYKWGSHAQNKFSAEKSSMVVSRLIILGLLPSEFTSLELLEEDRLELTDKDRKKLSALLKRFQTEDSNFWMEEAKEMLEVGFKTEIEAVCLRGKKSLTKDYLLRKIAFHLQLYE